MAIDPETHAKQLRAMERTGRLAAVPAEREERPAAPCLSCGDPTQSKGGYCRACKNGFRFKAWPFEKLMSVRRHIDAELKRRRSEIDAAIGGTP
jgi:hypothetical protein